MTEVHLPLLPPFVRLGPADPATPLVVAVPHAGRHYPDAVERERAVAWRVIEDLEDRYADRLIGPTVAAGAVAIVGTHGRAWIDLNRGAEDAGDPDAPAVSARARAGLGLIPTRLAGRALWRESPDADETARRLATVHAPYHATVARALAAAQARHGHAVLVDCHSMPPLGRPGRPGARIVIGDRHGAAAAPALAEAMLAVCAERGVPAARNVPYAGAYTLSRHGCPRDGVHAVQVEIDRSLYLLPGLREPSADLARIADLFGQLCRVALEAARPQPWAEAAE